MVVTEGFTGNIALKTAEGTARQIATYLRAAMSRTLHGAHRLSSSPWTPSSALREKMDPRTVNGGVFLGLNGIVIKSHGGTERRASPRALELGYNMARSRLIDKINQRPHQFYQRNAGCGSRRSRSRVQRERNPFDRSRRRRLSAREGPDQ